MPFLPPNQQRQSTEGIRESGNERICENRLRCDSDMTVSNVEHGVVASGAVPVAGAAAAAAVVVVVVVVVAGRLQ